jgi:hypothetical protein
MRTPLAAVIVLSLTPALHAQSTLIFEDNFESGLGNWTSIDTGSLGSLWHLQDAAAPCSSLVTPFPSGTKAAWFGQPPGCSIDAGPVHWHDGALLQTTGVPLPVTAGSIRLSFRTSSQGEDDLFWDQRRVHVMFEGQAFAPPHGHATRQGNLLSSPWRTAVFDLTRFAGGTIRLGFDFWSGDEVGNTGYGWFIDDVRIEILDVPAFTFCAGDGIQLSCPCGNVGDPGRGCANSFDARGALIQAGGTPSVSADTLTITASEVSPAFVTFFSSPVPGHQGGLAEFGDGVRCIASSITRIQGGWPVNGVTTIPLAGGAPVSTQMLVLAPGDRRCIQALYRDAPSFCTPATFNVSNGLMLTWRP